MEYLLPLLHIILHHLVDLINLKNKLSHKFVAQLQEKSLVKAGQDPQTLKTEENLPEKERKDHQVENLEKKGHQVKNQESKDHQVRSLEDVKGHRVENLERKGHQVKNLERKDHQVGSQERKGHQAKVRIDAKDHHHQEEVKETVAKAAYL